MIGRSRCIYLTFEHPEMALIEELRSAFDPAKPFVPAHITVVFPFVSSIENARLSSMMEESLDRLGPIEFGFSPLSFTKGFAVLPIMTGRQRFIDIYSYFYRRELREFLPFECFNPHVTVGRYKQPEDMKAITHNCRSLQLTQVGYARTIVLETILPSGCAQIEWELRL